MKLSFRTDVGFVRQQGVASKCPAQRGQLRCKALFLKDTPRVVRAHYQSVAHPLKETVSYHRSLVMEKFNDAVWNDRGVGSGRACSIGECDVLGGEHIAGPHLHDPPEPNPAGLFTSTTPSRGVGITLGRSMHAVRGLVRPDHTTATPGVDVTIQSLPSTSRIVRWMRGVVAISNSRRAVAHFHSTRPHEPIHVRQKRLPLQLQHKIRETRSRPGMAPLAVISARPH
mmetsp:Transcript_12703/g.28956  ORF Transcript_12703/g.28956 Transcript_12703/m.28956 type:complete len:227 (-) Transcript_12703:385-1065(-)